jgi:GNAT superfamily N-acetyltransferase
VEKSRPKHSHAGLAQAMSPAVPPILRSHQPVDLDWVIQAHKAHSKVRGFNEEFEAMVERIVADFARNYDPKWEHCWIAETDGEPVGCVFLVKRSEALAQLRLLFVDRRARGLGIGRQLIEECVMFARRTGYHKVTLGTNDIATVARHLYEKAGFQLVESKPRHVFGHDMVDETWELGL